MDSDAKTIRLVLGDQLNPLHSWFASRDPDVLYVLMEVRQETDYVLHHAQKIIAIFAAMRDFADHLRRAGHRVHYLCLDDPDNRQQITANLADLMTRHRAQRVEWQSPDEWRLRELLRQWSGQLAAAHEEVSSEHFLLEIEALTTLFSATGPHLMERFYRTMRQRHKVLLDDSGKPAGGKWNFDHDNRKPWRGQPPEPADFRPLHDHSALWRMIEDNKVSSFGQPQADAFRWPVNRDEALVCLDAFIENVLPHFGDFEDAMNSVSPRLFHSLLSFALNVKMLNPREVIERVEHAYRSGQAPLAAVEGFVRQILGWREYIRGIYWSQMPSYRDVNVLEHERPLPRWFWTGDTRMRCLQIAITQSLETAHAHHIQRLMVIGNFALLAGLNPQALHHWYLGIYIDAFEWVELPNTVGMSQWADGGIIATKPYVSSSAYIHRMSDYCKGCRYDRTKRTGSDACPFNALYWDFFARNEKVFGTNVRLSMVYVQLTKMKGPVLDELRERANELRQHLDEL